MKRAVVCLVWSLFVLSSLCFVGAAWAAPADVKILQKQIKDLAKLPASVAKDTRRIALMCDLRTVLKQTGKQAQERKLSQQIGSLYLSLQKRKAPALPKSVWQCAKEAQYSHAMSLYQAALALKVKSDNPMLQRKEIQAKLKAYDEAARQFRVMSRFKHHPTTVCALWRINDGKVDIITNIIDMPAPKMGGRVLKPEAAQMFKVLIDQKFVTPLLADAQKKYTSALAFARKHGLKGKCVDGLKNGAKKVAAWWKK